MSTGTTPAEAKGGSRLYLWMSVTAGLMIFFIIPAFCYPMGPKSHYGPEGTILAVVAGIAGCYGFFGCPRRPIPLKLGTALVCIFSATVAVFAVIQFIRFGQGT
jgi:hypothetical protein